MNKANIVLGVGVVVALILGVMGAFKTPSQNIVERIVDRTVGAIPGTEVDSQEFTINGVTQYYYSCEFQNSSTSTPCSFKSPSASTTIEYLGFQLEENSSGWAVYAARATNSWATTTNLITMRSDGGDEFAAFASSTLTNQTLPDNILKGSSYINIGLESFTTATGSAMMILREL